ncbi:O-antigen ligase family protein [Vibrio tetraodonis]|uniref:O-antigen ligase family protein n=1 Tax=Vibrio tetraodonis TaxID=2231647 RepID=UPI000E0BB8B0|nr:O-antigen ligase family protein [Vibrio tetraodonis]
MNLQNFKVNNEKLAALSVFLVLSLLLITKNFSVAVVSILLLVSLYSTIKAKNSITWDRGDVLVIICLSAYFLSNIPLFIIDEWNFRYFKGASRIILCIPIYFYLKYLVATHKVYHKPLIFGTIFGSLGAFIIAYYQFGIKGMLRVDGFLFSINFGYLACALSVLSLFLIKFGMHRFFLLISFALASSATFMSLTRGAIIIIPIALLTFIALEYKRVGIKTVLAIALLSIGVIMTIYNNVDSFKERVEFSVQEAENIIRGNITAAESSGGRLMLWKAATEAFKANPWIGLTYSQRDELNKELEAKQVVNTWTTTVQRGHAHSQYFEQLASGGILGLIALTCMLLIPFVYFFRHRNRSNAAYVGVFFVMAISICCLTEVPLQQNLISTFYGFMLALFFAVTQQEIKNHKEAGNGQISSQG